MIKPVKQQRPPWRVPTLDGTTLVVAATVAMASGLMVDTTVAMVIIPAATALYTAGVVQIAKQRASRSASLLKPLKRDWLSAGMQTSRRRRKRFPES